MKTFAFRALSSAGELVSGELAASNAAELESRLNERGLQLINAKANPGRLRWQRPLPRSELIQFCFHFEQLLEAGIPPCESLASLGASCRHSGMRRSILRLHADIAGGQPISAAASLQPATFSPAAIALLRAGEAAGQLPEAIRAIGQMTEREDELARYQQRVALYPALVGSLILLVAIVALTRLVPELEQLFRSSGLELPWQTRMLVALAEFTIRHGWSVLAIFACVAGATCMLLRYNPAMRVRRDRLLLKLPLLGGVLGKLALARIAGVLASLYGAGINLIDAIELAAATAPNLGMHRAMLKARQHIIQGQPLAAAFARTGLFPPLLESMLSVGEQSGRLEQVLAKVEKLCRSEVAHALQRLQAALEPALTLLLGLLLLWLASATLGPIYDLLARLPA